MLSFGASFAFFGLAGFLQNAAVADAEAAEEAAAQAVVPVETVVEPGDTTVQVESSEVVTSEWLGPVQPVEPALAADTAPASAPVVEQVPPPEPAPAPAPAPVEVDGHTGGS